MKLDKTVVYRLKNLPKAASVDNLALVDEYEKLCKLSTTSSTHPQVIDRAKHWERKAGPFREKINRLMETYPVELPKLKKRDDVTKD